MKKTIFFLVLAAFTYVNVFSQADTTKHEKIKKGFSFGPLPVVAYNTDEGFKYGALLNIFHYGDGSNYPNYNHKVYLEWSRTTNGGGINQITYDAKTLIPGIRMMLEAKYTTEIALDFYGFNGAQANFNNLFSDDSQGNDDYISRVYYRHARKMLRLKADFQGIILEKNNSKLNWLAGFVHYNSKISKVDIDAINEKITDENQKLPNEKTLYERYVDWGVIRESEKNGGMVNLFKAGVVYDTRDNEANPNSGMWSEALLLTAPSFLGNDNSYTKLMLTHRQYFTLFPKRLTFAYRLSYQSKIAGTMPFYMLPLVFDSKETKDGLGGSKNLRGIMRNRITGDGFAFGNFEFRWKFLSTVLFNQNLYLALNPFVDAGIITKKYDFDTSDIPAGQLKDFQFADEKIHLTYGMGFRIAINSNFIIAADYGFAADKQDGNTGLYIGLDYIF